MTADRCKCGRPLPVDTHVFLDDGPAMAKAKGRIAELEDRLVEEHEGSPGRVDARLWEQRAHEKEHEAAEAKERIAELEGILATTADRLNTALRESGRSEMDGDYRRSYAIRDGIVSLYDHSARQRQRIAELEAIVSGKTMHDAHAEGRREAFEEAAAWADNMRRGMELMGAVQDAIPDGNPASPGGPGYANGAAYGLAVVVQELRARAKGGRDE